MLLVVSKVPLDLQLLWLAYIPATQTQHQVAQLGQVVMQLLLQQVQVC
jgi:hypothetical protein